MDGCFNHSVNRKLEKFLSPLKGFFKGTGVIVSMIELLEIFGIYFILVVAFLPPGLFILDFFIPSIFKKEYFLYVLITGQIIGISVSIPLIWIISIFIINGFVYSGHYSG